MFIARYSSLDRIVDKNFNYSKKWIMCSLAHFFLLSDCHFGVKMSYYLQKMTKTTVEIEKWTEQLVMLLLCILCSHSLDDNENNSLTKLIVAAAKRSSWCNILHIYSACSIFSVLFFRFCWSFWIFYWFLKRFVLIFLYSLKCP